TAVNGLVVNYFNAQSSSVSHFASASSLASRVRWACCCPERGWLDIDILTFFMQNNLNTAGTGK
ncbi:MAG: hypothetical protein ACYSTW_08030, partial [Planctomycetota bacterium]